MRDTLSLSAGESLKTATLIGAAWVSAAESRVRPAKRKVFMGGECSLGIPVERKGSLHIWLWEIHMPGE
jgi:hypothetical protein